MTTGTEAAARTSTRPPEPGIAAALGRHGRTSSDEEAEFDMDLIRQGVFVLPGNRRFMSLAHTEQDLEDSFAAFDAACRKL